MTAKRTDLRAIVPGIFFFLVVATASASLRGVEKERSMKYPDAPKSETVDVYHGARIADPYRPLEDPP